MAAVLGIICLMITGVAVRARQVRGRTACSVPPCHPNSCPPGDFCYYFSGYIRHYKMYLDLFKFRYVSNNQSMTYNFQEYERTLDRSSSFYRSPPHGSIIPLFFGPFRFLDPQM